MNMFIIIFNFNDWDNHMTVQDSLEEHGQIAAMLTEMQAVQLTPNAFVVRTDLDADEFRNEFTPFLDRREDHFVLAVEFPCSAIAPKETLEALFELLETADASEAESSESESVEISSSSH